MASRMRILHYPKSGDYEIVSEDGSRLRLSGKEFDSVRKNMNGIALALAEQAKEKKK